jgi:hypothetical protein
VVAEIKLDLFQLCGLIMLAILKDSSDMPACIILNVLLYIEL